MVWVRAHVRCTFYARISRDRTHFVAYLRCSAAWVGDGGAASPGGGSGEKKPVETDLVPLVEPGQVANEAVTGASGEKQPVSLGRKLGDGSYVPAPTQPPGGQHRTQQELRAGSSPAEENSDALAAANEGTIAEFDLSKILRHIKELNYLVRRCAHENRSARAAADLLSYYNKAAQLTRHFLSCCLRMPQAGDGSAQTAQRADGAHVLVEMDPLPLTFFRNGILIREGPFRPFSKPDAKAFMKDLQDGYFPCGFVFSRVCIRWPVGCALFVFCLKACRILLAQVRAEVRVP